MRESGKGCPTSGEQPDFIAIPNRADGIDDGAAFFIFFPDKGQKHANAEIEAFQEVETRPQNSDQYEPQGLQKFV